MGVRTEADERLDEASEYVKQAIRCMSAVVIEDCWGADDFTEEAQDRHREAFNLLLDVKRKLGR